MHKIFFSPFLFLFLLTAALCGAEIPSPVFETTFESPDGKKVIDNIAPSADGVLREGAVLEDSPAGKVLKVGGRINNGALFPAADKLNLAEEYTVSGWFFLPKLPDRNAKGAARSCTLFSRGDENWRACVNADGMLMVQTTSPEREYYISNSGRNRIPEERWFHVAATYSVSGGVYELFINGVRYSSRKSSVDKKKQPPVAIPVPSTLLLGTLPNYFPMKGLIGRTRVYAKALNSAEITASEQDYARKLLAGLRETIRREIGESADGKQLLEKVSQLEKKPLIALDALDAVQAEYNRRRKVALLERSGAANRHFAYSAVDPESQELLYHDSDLPKEGLNGKILVAMARNEFESASFVIKPVRDVAGFLPVLEPLKSGSGEVLSPDIADIRLLKLLIGAGKQWIPGVLLHDDGMVKTDPEKMEMFLRLSFPSGVKYYKTDHDRKHTLADLMIDKLPLYDSGKLLPLALKKGMNRQFFITFKTTPDMKPGLYTSRVRLMSEGREIGSIPLKLRILPFELPEPATNYDLSREYTTAVYYFDRLQNGTRFSRGGSLCIYDRNAEQVGNELKNLREHGIRRPEMIMNNNFPRWHVWGPKPYGEYKFPGGSERADEMMRERIRLLKEAGFSLRPLYLHTGGNLGFRHLYSRREHKEILRDFIRRGNAFFQKELGHTDIYHYGIDEADGDVLKSEFEVWEDMREMGVKIFTTIKKANVPLVAGKLDVAVAVHRPDKESAAMMHRNGGRLWVYATPFYATLDKPFLHRKAYGFDAYFADYDGVYNYSYNHWSPELGMPWDKAESLVYVMPTADGVLDSPGWEGFREGIDDVRYATKLRMEIERNLSSPDTVRRRAAERAKKYLAEINTFSPGFDPGWTRMKMIDMIIQITEAVLEK